MALIAASSHHRISTTLRSERGQMAIFIALIFQVLFVFFAMIINVGLIVHDKINLQNSVDLAAYYAAQRQAEMLNAIAHQNYQIRQAWKLLSWRIRVLGDLGYRDHPIQDDYANNNQDIPAFSSGMQRSLRLPTVCINHDMWGFEQNVCHNANIQIPTLPDFQVINPFFPGNFGAQVAVDILRNVAKADCNRTGPINFNIAIRWARAYRTQIARAKATIRLYADRLSKSSTEFYDIRGDTVKGGALKTLDRNLTRANSRALKEGGENSFRLINSLGMVGGREKWLNEVPIYPTIFYTDLIQGAGTSCKGTPKQINGMDEVNRPHNAPDPNTQDDIFRNEPNEVDDLFHSVFGVEKNPWAMAYVGVYAETKPRKPYLPFSDPITLKAKAFAKPFGGRIGPWYYKKWPEGSDRSSGPSSERTDILAPIPLDATGAMMATAAEKELGVPNYSRFPGDRLGLASRAALALFKKVIDTQEKAGRSLLPAFYSGTPSDSDGLALGFENGGFGNLNQPLPLLGYSAPWIREVEVAAVAPDLFDTTYYSIDPDAFYTYTKPSIEGGIIPGDEIPYDIGSKGATHIRNIEKQIEISESFTAGVLNFWKLKDVNHLLTGWAPSGAFEYSFPEESFGKCFDEAKQPIPGKCARGGRVGYSVKIVSEDYLNSTDLPLGGPGISGRIVNPPPEEF